MSERRIEIALEGKLADIVMSAIASGDFSSADEVVSEALALWQLDRMADDADMARLRAEVDEALNEPGPRLTIDEVRAHLASRRRADEAA